MISHRFQVVVVGSGFGGSLMAMVARRLGFSTGLIERGKHPRFVIGESTTPLTNLLLQELAREYDLPALGQLSKWGSWQRHLPQLPCGLKRGFTFYHHEWDRAYLAEDGRKTQLLVGASPNDKLADTHWYRPDFDRYLVEQAQALAVDYLDEVDLTTASELPDGMRLAGARRGEELEITADLVIDASGARGFLYRLLNLPQKSFAGLPPTQALFSHFTGVQPLPASFGITGHVPPYPPENAAVHHVFAGGWIWMLKFNNGITSAGVAATDPIAKEFELSSGEPGWRRLLERLPSLRDIFASARSVAPFVYQPRLAFQCGGVTGKNWVLLPSAAGVVDPLLSTGFPLTLLGITRLGRMLRANWGNDSWSRAAKEYGESTSLELQATADLVGALYATMDRFALFKSLSLLYFAAASFSEISRRLGKSELANSFLLCRDGEFGPQLARLCAEAREMRGVEDQERLAQRIRKAIAPFDLAGLTDASRDPWYPARGEDILANVGRLGVSREEVVQWLNSEN